MLYEKLDLEQYSTATREKVLSICPAGVMESTITLPSTPGALRPLLALHGIARNSADLNQAFSKVAESTGRIVVVPHFSEQNWPVYQRMTRRARPDKTLLALLATLRDMDPVFQGPMDLFGFSGGAQLAHRFAMLYPETVADLHLGAAGWYTFPEEDVPYPYGLSDDDSRKAPWGRLMRSGLKTYLQRSINVFVGANDTHRDKALRQNPIVDGQQGFHRLERAGRYVESLNRHQAALGLPCTARLTVLRDCDHSFSTCAQRGELATRVCSSI